MNSLTEDKSCMQNLNKWLIKVHLRRKFKTS